MYEEYTQNPLLRPLVRCLTKAQRQNLIVLILAVQLARSLIQRRLALYLICAISSASCLRRLERILEWRAGTWEAFSRAWVRAVLAAFAPGNGMLVLLIDWTLHRDRCRSLWVMLPVGGRAVPLAFWLAPPTMGGKGAQRAFEDEALTKLREWLPEGRRAVLIGDRGFRGWDRMRFLKRLGFRFVLRVTGDTKIEGAEGWVALREVTPARGAGWQRRQVRYGKRTQGGPLFVNLVAVRQELAAPKAVRTNKGKPTGKTVEETTWFLATDLPLRIDVVALYFQRMQIEESYRDLKDLLGLEQERTEQPWERLQSLVWALTVGFALDLQQGDAMLQAPARLPLRPKGRSEVPPAQVPQYRAESATREGLHTLVVQAVLGCSPFTRELQAIAAKSARMQARPQVRDRRRSTPAPRRRVKLESRLHVHE
jgi:DDE family transposase